MQRKNRNYQKGRAREYGAMRRLQKEGAIYVKRSYGSHGMFDIIAVFPDRTRLVQVKKDGISGKELARLVEFAGKIIAPNLGVEVWTYKKRKRQVHELRELLKENQDLWKQTMNQINQSEAQAVLRAIGLGINRDLLIETWRKIDERDSGSFASISFSDSSALLP